MTLHSTAQANPVYVLTPEDLAILSSALEEAMSSPDKDSQSTETLNLFRDLATQLSDAKRENITAAQLEEILGYVTKTFLLVAMSDCKSVGRTSIATDPKLCEIVMRSRLVFMCSMILETLTKHCPTIN